MVKNFRSQKHLCLNSHAEGTGNDLPDIFDAVFLVHKLWDVEAASFPAATKIFTVRLDVIAKATSNIWVATQHV